jgi:hypothetical protein
MTKQGLASLNEQLRASAPAALAGLSEDDLHDLAGKLRSARHRQAAELQAAAEAALGHLPRLLRGPVRKVMGL